jgi:hypothetical protein
VKADELMALGSAHGIDFTAVAGNASNILGIAHKRRQTRDERMSGIPVTESVKGHQTRVYRRPEWTAADSGHYGKDVPRMPWLAARYSICGDMGGYEEMHRGLTARAIHQATANNWPMTICKADGSRGFYIEDLSALVLDAEMHKPIFDKAPAMYGHYMNVTEDLWGFVVVHWHDALRGEYERWLSTARGFIQRWINGDQAA